MISIIQNNDVYEIRFKYDPRLLSYIRDVPGRQWIAEHKVWTVPKNNLGWFLNAIKDTPYENQVQLHSDEHIGENEKLESTAVARIPDIDISDITQYVQEGSVLYPHQLDFLKFAKSKLGKGFILADDMGCLASDTKIIVKNDDLGGKDMGSSILIIAGLNDMFRVYHNCRTFKILSLKEDTGEFFYNTVRDVLYKGMRKVYWLKTYRNSIRATGDHEFYTTRGYVQLHDLKIGDYIVSNYNSQMMYDLVLSISEDGKEAVYDIVMEEPYRNFVANNMVVHNCGKTLEVLNYALYQHKVSGYKHCLIICCVNSAKFSWQEDIEKHTNGQEHAYILGTRKKRGGGYNYNTSGKKKVEDLETGHMYGDPNAPELPYFIITNIESLRTSEKRKYILEEAIIKMIKSGDLNMIPIDEIHKNASPKATQGKLILDIKKRTGNQVEWIPMTGTPIVNRPTDVYTPLRLVNGHDVKSYYTWCQSFCIYGGFGDYEVVEYKNINFLKEMLQDNMLRRLKTEVLADLPPKIYYTEYVENTSYQQKLYSDVLKGIYQNKSQILASVNPLAQMLRLRQVNGSPELVETAINVADKEYLAKNAKLCRLIILVDEIIDRGEKVVIFSNWVEPLRTIYRYVSARYKTACYTGTMPEDERQTHKKWFIEDPDCKIMLGTIGALGVNHTLTVANNCILYDMPWQNAARIQAEDRLVRIGQDKPVNVYTLITKDTIDEAVYKILTDKQAISDFMVDDSLDLKKNPELFDLLLGK